MDVRDFDYSRVWFSSSKDFGSTTLIPFPYQFFEGIIRLNKKIFVMKKPNLLFLCILFSINSYTQINKNIIFSNNDLSIACLEGKLNINYNQKASNKIEILFADTLQIKSRKLVNKFSNIEFNKLAKEFFQKKYMIMFNKIIYYDSKNECFVKFEGKNYFEKFYENNKKSPKETYQMIGPYIEINKNDKRPTNKLSFSKTNHLIIFIYINDEFVIAKNIFFDNEKLIKNDDLPSDLHLLKNKFIQSLEPKKMLFAIQFDNENFFVNTVKDKSNPKLVYFEAPLYYDTIEIESPKIYLGQVTREQFNLNKEALLKKFESLIVGYDGTHLYYEYSNSQWNDCVRFYYHKSTRIETLPGRGSSSWSFTSDNVKKDDGLYNVIIHNKSDIYTSFYINLKNKLITKINNPIDYDEVKY